MSFHYIFENSGLEFVNTRMINTANTYTHEVVTTWKSWDSKR